MQELFNLDSPVMRALSKLADLIVLNLLTVICSIPVVTIGAAATALYTSVDRLMRDEGRPIGDYFRTFRENFKQATILWLIMLVSGILLAVSLLFYLQISFPGRLFFFIVACILAIAWCLASGWVFPLQAKFYNKVKATLTNSLLCGIAYLPRSVALAALNLLPLVLLLCAPYWFLRVGPLWVLLWFSVAAYLSLKLLRKPYAKMGVPQEPALMEETSSDDPS